MTPTSIIAAGTLLTLAALLVFAHTANLEPAEPTYPKGEPRSRLLMAALACFLAFFAGAVL